MPRLLQYGLSWACWAAGIKRHHRDHGFISPVIEVLDKQIKVAVVRDRERIRVKAETRIGDDVPRGSLKRARIQEIRPVHCPPAGPPMWGIAAYIIKK